MNYRLALRHLANKQSKATLELIQGKNYNCPFNTIDGCRSRTSKQIRQHLPENFDCPREECQIRKNSEQKVSDEDLNIPLQTRQKLIKSLLRYIVDTSDDGALSPKVYSPDSINAVDAINTLHTFLKETDIDSNQLAESELVIRRATERVPREVKKRVVRHIWVDNEGYGPGEWEREEEWVPEEEMVTQYYTVMKLVRTKIFQRLINGSIAIARTPGYR